MLGRPSAAALTFTGRAKQLSSLDLLMCTRTKQSLLRHASEHAPDLAAAASERIASFSLQPSVGLRYGSAITVNC